jgi:hypothetical protein
VGGLKHQFQVSLPLSNIDVLILFGCGYLIVYGALLWSLGKTMSSPEVTRVYVGSFWQEPLRTMDNAALFEDEEKDLMKDLAILPRQSAVRKINEVSYILIDEIHHPLVMRCIVLNL